MGNLILILVLSVEQTNDNGYIVTGGFSIDASETMDAILLKTDSNGDEEWCVTFGGVNSDECFEVHQTEDGGYIVAGLTYSYGEEGPDAWLVKFWCVWKSTTKYSIKTLRTVFR